jgi:hypothetical protein
MSYQFIDWLIPHCSASLQFVIHVNICITETDLQCETSWWVIRRNRLGLPDAPGGFKANKQTFHRTSSFLSGKLSIKVVPRLVMSLKHFFSLLKLFCGTQLNHELLQKLTGVAQHRYSAFGTKHSFLCHRPSAWIHCQNCAAAVWHFVFQNKHKVTPLLNHCHQPSAH